MFKRICYGEDDVDDILTWFMFLRRILLYDYEVYMIIKIFMKMCLIFNVN